MTSETYMALAGCARKRIEQEWSCSAAERSVLQLVADLSFELGQTWALVPCLGDFAAVLGVHKSTVSRALRSALKKGFVLVLKRREETLYSICTETRGTATPADAQQGEAVRSRLVKLNQTRLQGLADADGQQRLPGVLPSEEVEAPGRAFVAMMEEPQAASNAAASASNQGLDATLAVPRGTMATPETRATAGGGDDEPPDELHRKLEAMVRAQEKAWGEVPEAGPARVPASPQEKDSLEKEMVKLCRGLNPEQRHALAQVRTEFQSGGKLQEAAFFNWGRLWRKHVINHTRICLEVAGEHKALRLSTGKAANEPGAWMYRAMQDLLGAVANTS
jgi:hypothetical protein